MFTNSLPACTFRFTLWSKAGHCCALTLLLLTTLGCNQDMDNQPKLDPLEQSDFFADGHASRQWVAGTVARGHSPQEITTHSTHFLTGTINDKLATTLPDEVTKKWSEKTLLARGQQRYQIFCSHCHGVIGNGQGIVPQRGFPEPPTYHSQRLRAEPLGHIYQVIQYGHGQMPAHGGQIPPADRWAIAAYVRALQWSQHADAEKLSPADLQQLNAPTTTETP